MSTANGTRGFRRYDGYAAALHKNSRQTFEDGLQRDVDAVHSIEPEIVLCEMTVADSIEKWSRQKELVEHLKRQDPVNWAEVETQEAILGGYSNLLQEQLKKVSDLKTKSAVAMAKVMNARSQAASVYLIRQLFALANQIFQPDRETFAIFEQQARALLNDGEEEKTSVEGLKAEVLALAGTIPPPPGGFNQYVESDSP